MQYILSPEFHRNLWLKFSPVRLAALPLGVGMLLLIVFNINLRESPVETLLGISLTCYSFIVFIWGNYEAASALQEDVKGKTWDLQKMSPITPGSLAFGKLFGAVSFTWYAAAFFLAIFVYSYSHYMPPTPPPSYPNYHHVVKPHSSSHDMKNLPGEEPHNQNIPSQHSADNDSSKNNNMPHDLSITAPPLAMPAHPLEAKETTPPLKKTPDNILSVTLFLLLAGIAGQVASFLCSFSDFTAVKNKLGRIYIPRAIGPFIVGAIISSCIFDQYVQNTIYPSAKNSRLIDVTWFGTSFEIKNFTMMSILFFLSWAFIGIYRTARAELMYPQTPIGWFTAVLTISLYTVGFVSTARKEYFLAVSSILFASTFAITYITMLTEAPNIEKYRRFFSYLRKKDWRKTFQNMPRWISLLGLLALFYLSTLITVPNNFDRIFSLLTTFILFAVRDGIFLHGIYISATLRHVSFYMLLYYIFAYALAPLLFMAVSGPNESALKDIILFMFRPEGIGATPPGFDAGTFFYPKASGNPIWAILPVTVEIYIAYLWLKSRKKAFVKN